MPDRIKIAIEEDCLDNWTKKIFLIIDDDQRIPVSKEEANAMLERLTILLKIV